MQEKGQNGQPRKIASITIPVPNYESCVLNQKSQVQVPVPVSLFSLAPLLKQILNDEGYPNTQTYIIKGETKSHKTCLAKQRPLTTGLYLRKRNRQSARQKERDRQRSDKMVHKAASASTAVTVSNRRAIDSEALSLDIRPYQSSCVARTQLNMLQNSGGSLVMGL